MAGGKLTPRQKMINMMYLVLTALLAMNVTNEILNAFKTVNNSIAKSNEIVTSKNNTTYDAFVEAVKDPQTAAKAQLWKPKADKIKAIASELSAFLETQKMEMKKRSGLQINPETKEEEFKVDDLEAPTYFMIEQKKGTEIYDRMLKFKKDMLAVLNPNDFEDPKLKADVQKAVDEFNKSLPINMPIPKSESGASYSNDGAGWSQANFHMTPTIAAVTILTKLQSDVKSSEAQMVDYCFKQIGSVKVIYDNFQAIASASTNYAMPGDPVEVYAGVGAFSEASKPNITINGSPVALVDGMATFKTTAAGAGEHGVPVKISYTKPDGTIATLDKTIKYTVGTPAGTAVMLDKMNVVYIGVDNPMTISSGAGDEKTSVSGNGLTLTKSGPGKYIARATAPSNTAGITVSVTGGKSTPFPIRVKRIPDPVPTLGGKLRGGNAQPGTIKAQSGIVPLLENFDFEAKFNVQSFSMVFVSKGEIFRAEASGPLFNAQMQGFLGRAKPKDVLYLEDIKVVGPDGQSRKLGQIVFTII
ncbi:MAG: gliding motility protein GldM [Chitinophagales bacterium]